jgi:hypothetical protein
MGTTREEMVNNALGLLGSDLSVTDLDTDATAQADVARRLYETLYVAKVQEYPWSFATQEETSQLAQLVDDSAEGFPRYGRPATNLRITRLFTEFSPKVDYRLEGDAIVVLDGTDGTETPIYLTGTVRPSEGVVSYGFALAFAAELAGWMAKPITESESTGQYWMDAAKGLWRQAKEADYRSVGTKALFKKTDCSLLTVR